MPSICTFCSKTSVLVDDILFVPTFFEESHPCKAKDDVFCCLLSTGGMLYLWWLRKCRNSNGKYGCVGSFGKMQRIFVQLLSELMDIVFRSMNIPCKRCVATDMCLIWVCSGYSWFGFDKHCMYPLTWKQSF